MAAFAAVDVVEVSTEDGVEARLLTTRPEKRSLLPKLHLRPRLHLRSNPKQLQQWRVRDLPTYVYPVCHHVLPAGRV